MLSTTSAVQQEEDCLKSAYEDRNLSSLCKLVICLLQPISRLTPLYAFAILVFMYIPLFLGEGPIWQSSSRRITCERSWWTNLLYINNFLPENFMEGVIELLCLHVGLFSLAHTEIGGAHIACNEPFN